MTVVKASQIVTAEFNNIDEKESITLVAWNIVYENNDITTYANNDHRAFDPSLATTSLTITMLPSDTSAMQNIMGGPTRRNPYPFGMTYGEAGVQRRVAFTELSIEGNRMIEDAQRRKVMEYSFIASALFTDVGV